LTSAIRELFSGQANDGNRAARGEKAHGKPKGARAVGLELNLEQSCRWRSRRWHRFNAAGEVADIRIADLDALRREGPDPAQLGRSSAVR
jgi:hypothetical protein